MIHVFSHVYIIGNEYPAIVEYAPFQRIPKQRSTRKKDPRVGTIESDPYYQDFIEALKAEETQRKSASKTNKQHFFETSASKHSLILDFHFPATLIMDVLSSV